MRAATNVSGSSKATRLTSDPQRAIERFLHREARLLDAGRFEEWLDLFLPDGIYWVPGQPGQIEARGVASIIYEDRALLQMRVRRIVHPRAHALVPIPRTTHLVSNIELLDTGLATDKYKAESAFLMSEFRDGSRRIFTGRYQHLLRLLDGELKIALKRVDLIDCDGIHAAMSIPF